MKKINLGILAHVDAGKTSLTERILLTAGVIKQAGSVDQGNTHTDTLALEKARGITIQSSVVSFDWHDITINLIDTPGHADFIAEVERALRVLDAVIFVVSAVEGIQAQTHVLMQTLRRLRKPGLIFINKIDRPGARATELIKDINQQLNICAFPMVKPIHIGHKNADIKHYITTENEEYRQFLYDTLSDNHDPFLLHCIDNDFNIAKADVIAEIQAQTRQGTLFPVYCGSAMTGVGIDALMLGIEHYLPHDTPDPAATITGEIFKIERNAKNEKYCYLNLQSGRLQLREQINIYRIKENSVDELQEKISQMHVFAQGECYSCKTVDAGHIVKVAGLHHAQIGDCLNATTAPANKPLFSKPKLQARIETNNPKHLSALFAAVQALSEQDPLICVQQQENDDILVQLYGEVQKEIITARLKQEYGITAVFSDSSVICIERPIGTGEAQHVIDRKKMPLEFYATLGFRIEPGPLNSGITYDMKAHKGMLPLSYHTVIEEALQHFCRTGLHGWQLTDCKITMTLAGVCPLSIAPHFRQLTPILLRDALTQAKTVVCEPYNIVNISIPSDMLNNVLLILSRYHAHTQRVSTEHDRSTIISEVCARHLYSIESQLPGQTHGRGVLTAESAGYRPIKDN